MFDGVTGQALSEEEEARRKKAAISYDGNPEGKDARMAAGMQNVNVDEQIRNIHLKFAERK
jgi:splicing factor 3A subunit 1